MKKSEKNLVLFLLATQVFALNTYTIKKAKALDISEEESTEIAWTAEQSANYILTHLNEVNEMRAEDGFLTAVYSAEVSDIIVDMFAQPTVEGKLIDFDGQKGYMIVGPNKEYYAYSPEYNPPFNDFTSGVHHYDEKLGFWYEDDAGNQVILGEPGNTTNVDVPPNDVLYTGQHLMGEYTIYEPDAYMLDRYGSNYVNEHVEYVYAKSFVLGFEYYESMVYYSEIEPHLEQITGPSINAYLAGLSITDYIATAHDQGDFTTIIKQNYIPNRYESSVYEAKTEAGLQSRTLSHIGGYNNFRKYVTSNYNDDANLTVDQIKEAVIGFFKEREITVTTENVYGISNLLKYHLDVFTKKCPLLMYVPTAFTYNDHYSVICGFRDYTWERIVMGIFKKKNTKVLLEIKESMWYKDSTYFDVFAYGGTDSYVCAFHY